MQICKRLLKAISIRTGIIGYCQGMNFVIAFLVQHELNE